MEIYKASSLRQRVKHRLHNLVYWMMCHFPDSQITHYAESRLRDDDGEPMRWRCRDCGRVYGNKGWIDVIIPDEQWITIEMPKDGGGLLCGACIIKRGEKLPGVTHARLEFKND